MSINDVHEAVKSEAPPSVGTKHSFVPVMASESGTPQGCLGTCGPATGANGKAARIKLTPDTLKAKSKPVPTVDPAVLDAWHASAMALASWASKGCDR